MLSLLNLIVDPLLLAAIIYLLAKMNVFFTFMNEPSIKAVVTGGKYVRFIVCVQGYHHDDKKMEMVKDSDDPDYKPNRLPFQWFTNLTGMYWVGVWPFRQIMRFPIVKRRLKKNMNEFSTMEGKIETAVAIVDELSFIIKRPVPVLGADLADGARMDMLLFGIFQVLSPYRLLFDLKGKFFDALDRLTTGCAMNYHKKVTYDSFRIGREMETEVFNSPTVMDMVDEIQPDKTTNKVLKEMPNQYFIPKLVGLIAQSETIADFSLSKEDQAFQAAAQEEKIAEKKGDAAIKTALAAKKTRILAGEAERQYQADLGAGEAERDKSLLKALIDSGLTPARASEIFNDIKKAEQMKELKGTIVENGARVGVNVQGGKNG